MGGGSLLLLFPFSSPLPPTITSSGFTSFGTGDLLEAIATFGSVSISTSHPNSGTYSCQINPVGSATAYYRVGTYGAASASCQLIDISFPSNQAIYIQFYFYATAMPSAREEIFRITDSSGNLIISIMVDLVKVYLGGAASLHTLFNPVIPDVMHSFSLQFQSIENGPFSLLLDNFQIGFGNDAFGVAATGPPTAAYLGKAVNTNSDGYNIYFSNLSWSVLNAIPFGLDTIQVPSGPGGVNNWTGTYANLNTVPPNQATPLTTTTTSSFADFVVTDPITAGIPAGSVINCVKVVGTIKYASGPNGFIIVGISIGGGGYFSATTPLTSSYADYGQVFITNPHSGLPWTVEDLSSIQVTLNNQSAAGRLVEACALYLLVNYSPASMAIQIQVSPAATLVSTPTTLNVSSTGGTTWLSTSPQFLWDGGTVGTITPISDTACTVAVTPGSVTGSFLFTDITAGDDDASAIVAVLGDSAFGDILVSIQGMLAANAAFSANTALITLWPEPFPQAGYPLAFIVPGTQRQIDAHVTGAGRYFAATEAEVTIRVIDHNLLDQSYQDIDRLTATTANAVGLLRTAHSAIDALNVRFAYATDGITPLTFEPLYLVAATRPRFYAKNTELAYVDLTLRVRYAFKITPIVPFPPPTMLPGPPPRTTLADLLLGVQALIVGGQVFTMAQTAISLYVDPFPMAGTPLCYVSPTDFRTFQPDWAGAGRYAATLDGSFIITIVIRGNSDWAFVDYDRLLDAIYGLYVAQQLIVQALELAFPLDPSGNFLSEVPIRLVSIGQPKYFDQAKSWLGIETVFSTKYNPNLTIELP